MNETSCSSNSSTSLAKSASDLVSRSTLYTTMTSTLRARTSSRSLAKAGLSMEPPEKPPSSYRSRMSFQPSWGLAFNVGFRRLPLIVEGVELLLQSILGRDPRVDGAAQDRLARLALHGRA